jgi:hypothetical protein
MSNKEKLEKPTRDPDLISKRGIPYWFAPEWVRDLNGSISKLKPIKRAGTVDLYMLSRTGNIAHIQGSIQHEFKKWHTDREIDYMLLGADPDELMTTPHDE